MNSATTKQFWKCFDALPVNVQRRAAEAFGRWQADPGHPGLHFKAVKGLKDVHSVRIGEGWRAIGRRKGGTIYWIWIGSHADYDRLIARS